MLIQGVLSILRDSFPSLKEFSPESKDDALSLADCFEGVLSWADVQDQELDAISIGVIKGARLEADLRNKLHDLVTVTYWASPRPFVKHRNLKC